MNQRLVLILMVLSFLLILFPAQRQEACTSILVTKGASKDGSTMISYSCDGEFHPRPRIIPAADYKPGEMFEVKGWDGIKGKIPQVAHTYKVVGLVNEHQLAIGETTAGGRTELINEDGMWDYYPLMTIALQRAKTAREAIDVMTSLAEEYGYCGEGESISIADKEEVWLFEIFGTGKGTKGAVWAAIRIPDGKICATANMARIGELPPNDPENCRYSKNAISFAIEKGYYNPNNKIPFHFAHAYNPPTEEQTRYSLRRVWSIFRRVAPSLNLSPDYSSSKKNAKPYDLYITPDQKLSVRDIIALHRDHYEGTEFDMTQDVTAGPFGAPDRWRPMKWQVEGKKYTWERPIATQQAGFVFVSQSRSYVPDEIGGINWFGFDNPYTNVFVPFYTSITELPECYTTGTLQQFTRDSAWWAFNFVANYANLRWNAMIEDIQKVQKEIEDLEFNLQPAIEKTAQELLNTNPSLLSTYLTNYCTSNAETAIKKWWRLADLLVTKYNDGYIQKEKGRPEEVGYPEKWLKNEVKINAEKKLLKEEKEIKREL